MLREVSITRYVTPLREGGSLPGIVEAEDLGTYVCKFRGAGQGLKVLVAEVIVSELARRIGLRTPRLVVLDLADDIARYEADEEVQDLLRASLGLNLGVDYLPGSFGYDGELVAPGPDAGAVLWLDAFTANVDRSWKNPNLLVWHGELWLIDHGASLYFHHGWAGGVGDPSRFAKQSWDATDRVMYDHLSDLPAADDRISALLTASTLVEILAKVPDDWLEPVPGAETPDALRQAYVAFLEARLATREWLPRGRS